MRLGLWLIASVAVLAVLFHRPLAHWAIWHFGTHFAGKMGLEADWKSSGSVLGDLAFDAVRLTGDDRSVLRSLKVDHAGLEYDLRRLRRGGVGNVVSKIVLRRVVADIDLTRAVPAAALPAKKTGKAGFRLPAVRVPVIEIEHVSLRLRHRGGVIEVDDFSLVIDPAKPGTICVARVAVPGMPELVDAAGTTRATVDSVTLENVALWPESTLDRLVVALADLPSGRIGAETAARQGPAAVTVQGSVGFGGAFGPTVEAQAAVRQVTHETLAFWGVPDGGMEWDGGEVGLRTSGPVLRPDLLATDLHVSGASLAPPGLPMASVGFTATLKEGTLTVADGRVAVGRNTAAVRASARVPQRWTAIAASLGQATIDVEAPALAELLPAGVDVTGAFTARAEVAFAQRALTTSTASVQGAGVVFQGLPIETVSAEVTTADGGVLAGQVVARLNATNGIDATGRLELRGEQGFEVSWKADCRDLATVPIEARPGLPWPTAGTLVSSGTAVGTLAAVRARDWAQVTGTAELEAAAIRMKDAALASLRVRAQSAAGEVRVDELAVRFDAENSISGTGRASLADGAAPISASLRAALPAVARLSGWSTLFGGPAVRGGSAVLSWEAHGEAGMSSIQGTGTARVRGLRVDGVPEVLGFEGEITQAGPAVTMKNVSATAGPWRAEGGAGWDGARVEVSGLTVWVKDQRVTSLTAAVPVGRGAGPGQAGLIPPDEPVSLKLTIEDLDFDRLSTALGRALPVRGRVRADASVSGTLRTLAGRLTADVTEVRPAARDAIKLEPAAVSVKAVLAEGRLTLDARATQKPLEPLTIEAQVPIDAVALSQNPGGARELPLTARVRLAESSLSFLPGWVPALKSVQGTASVDATLGGTVGRPQWQGTGTVTIPEARLTGVALPSIKDVVVKIRADEKRLTVQDASVMLAGGRLRIEGGADLSRLADPVLNLRLRADEVLVVRDENLSLRANADVACRGPVSRAAVTGTIDLVRGRVFKEIEFLPLSLPNQLPPPPPPTTLARTGPPALPPPLDAWTIDLVIRTRDPVRLMGNVARGNVVADLRVSGTGARPVLTGRATMEQMWLKLPFSRLTITEGAVVFTEDKPFDPQINVIGESIIDGRVVQVAVQGRALDPTVRLTSSPPLPEGEIASLLATGVTTSDLATRGDEAAGRAAFVVVQQAYRKMFRKTARSGDDDEPPRLSFQFSLFGSDPTRRNLSAVYELNPKWRVIGRVGESGTFRGMLHYLIRFR